MASRPLERPGPEAIRSRSGASDPTHAIGERLLRAAAGAGAMALALFAYRALLRYDPTAIGRADLAPSEAVFFSPVANSPFFVAAISAWLFYRRRRAFFRALGAPPARGLAAAGLAVAAALLAWGSWASAPDWLAVSFAAAWLAAGAWLGGRRAAAACALPAAVLLFLVPLPAVLVAQAVHALQLWTAAASTALLGALGIEALQSADRIAVAGGRVFQVIESCSGLRSTQTLLLAAILYTDLFPHSRLQRALVIAAAPVIGLLVNELRVMSLILNPYSAFAAVHLAQGLVMLVVGVLAVAGLDAVLARWLPARRGRPPAAPATGAPHALPLRRLVVLLAAAMALAGISLLPAARPAHARLGFSASDFGLRLEGWRFTPLKLDRVYLGSTAFREDAYRRYHPRAGGEPVDLFIGLADPTWRFTHPLTPKTIALGTGNRVSGGEPFALPGASGARAFVVHTREGPMRVVRWHRGIGSLAHEALREITAIDRTPLGRARTPLVVRLATPLPGHADPNASPRARQAALADADRRLRDFAGLVLAEIEAASSRTQAQQHRAAAPPAPRDAGSGSHR